MDNGRQNYRSLKLASALTIMALLQCVSLSPYSFIDGQTEVLRLTLPGLGIPLVSALNATAGEERLYVIGSRGYHILTIMVAYALLALVWAIAGVGNVSNIRGGKAAGMWAMYTSTVWSFFYLVWLCTQWSWTMEKPGWAVVHALVLDGLHPA